MQYLTKLTVGVINYVFSLWYITEVCMKMHIYGIKDFFTRRPTESIVVSSVSHYFN